jgi:hypothetical protein
MKRTRPGSWTSSRIEWIKATMMKRLRYSTGYCEELGGRILQGPRTLSIPPGTFLLDLGNFGSPRLGFPTDTTGVSELAFFSASGYLGIHDFLQLLNSIPWRQIIPIRPPSDTDMTDRHGSRDRQAYESWHELENHPYLGFSLCWVLSASVLSSICSEHITTI